MKLARQYFYEKDPESKRTRFIAREQSYHGTTLGSLSMGGHVARRAKFEPMLLNNISRVSPCFSYRHQGADESDEQYVAKLADELDREFQRVGPENVCAFVAEPIVGAVSPPQQRTYLRRLLTQEYHFRRSVASPPLQDISKPCEPSATSTAPC